MGIVAFLYGWQELMGAILGALIALLVTYYFHFLKDKNARKQDYDNLLLILNDIRSFVSKFEEYKRQSKENKVLYERIFLHPSYSRALHLFNSKPEIQSTVQRIYDKAQSIKYKLDLSDKDLSKYAEAMGLIRYYLSDIYHNFNIVAKETKLLSRKYGYLKFPKSFNFYSKDYVDQKIKDLDLEYHH